MRKIYWHLGGLLLLLFFPFFLFGFGWGNYTMVVFGIVWFGGISWLLLRSIGRPLREVYDYLENLRLGNPVRNRLARRDDYYGLLAKSLDKLERAHTSHLSTLHGRMEEIQAILTSMSEGVVATDITGRISLINPAAADLFNLAPGQGVGEFPYKVFPSSELGEIFHQVYVKGYAMEKETIWPGKPERILNLHLALIIDEVDEIRGVVAVIGDVTKLRRLESMRKDFVANVSHELKTPLTSIKGFIETLMESDPEEKQVFHKFLTIINHETDRLTHLIDDLLAVSRLESGRAELSKADIPLAPLVEEIILSSGPRIHEKQLEFTRKLEAPAIYGDENLLREVIINLFDNAIKYTPAKGKVEIGSYKTDDGVVFYVKDTGIGIPPESLNRIFERFYRVDKGRSREMGGTGLGLSIVKHIIERHGGKVFVASEPGRGSEFSFRLPLSKKPDTVRENGTTE
jgi:two-component system phosphate regulon sensor histidine kinase PhoR